uniref:Adaptor related protein complex 5 subunit zeta 1 n=1 Tax=Equus caballus TaxID=9796 RepID=A0A5F5PI98_HORSE
MFSAGAESLLRQAREIPDEELKKFCSRVSKLLQKEDVGPEAIDALQRLFLIVSATKYSRRLEQTCVDLLQTTLCSPACPEQLQLLCAAILRERSPCDSLRLSCEHVQNARQLSLVASVLLAQGDKQQEVRSVGQHVFRVLESRQPEGPSPRPLLPVVTKVIGLAPGALQEDQTNLLSKRLVDWLRYASLQQGLAHSAGGFFSTPRGRQPGPVTEVDGAVATDFFTVLSTGQHFTEDQWLNVQAFSMLRAWLLHSGPPGGPSAPDTDDRSELEGSTLSVLSATSTASRLLPPQERLREKAFEYCQRLIEQSNRLPGGGGAGAGRALQAGPLLPVPHPLLPEGLARAALWGPGVRAGAAARRPVLPEPRGGSRRGHRSHLPAPVHQDPLRALPQPHAGLRVRPVLQGQPPPVRQKPRHPQVELPQSLQVPGLEQPTPHL